MLKHNVYLVAPDLAIQIADAMRDVKTLRHGLFCTAALDPLNEAMNALRAAKKAAQLILREEDHKAILRSFLFEAADKLALARSRL